MLDFFIRLLTAGVIFAAIDTIWLSVIANKLYKSQIGSLLLDKPNMGAAIVFYVIFLVGLVVFVLNPALQANDWWLALGLGALFGLVTYATYDLTNRATLKGFPLKLAVIDIVWGIVLTASVAVASYFIIGAFS